jgi:hypothetical protein
VVVCVLQASRVDNRPRIYTCERVALRDDQILAPDNVRAATAVL